MGLSEQEAEKADVAREYFRTCHARIELDKGRMVILGCFIGENMPEELRALDGAPLHTKSQ